MSEKKTVGGRPRKSKRELLAEEALKNKQNAKAMKVIIVGTVVIVLGALLAILGIAFSNMSSGNDNVEVVAKGDPMTPKYTTLEGSYHILPDGGVDTEWNNVGDTSKKRVQFFMDPQCPGCGVIERGVHDDVAKLNADGKIDLYYNVVSFLDGTSTDKYSSRAANALITVAENDPTKFSAFLKQIFAEDKQPGEGMAYKSVSNTQLAEWAKEVGVSDKTAEMIKKNHYVGWIAKHTQTQSDRTDLFADGFGTPSIFVGGTMNSKGTVVGAEKVVFSNKQPVNKSLIDAIEKVK